MNTLSSLVVPNYVLTHEGLFFRYPGDLLKVVRLLSQYRIRVTVLDTQFAFLLEEAQKRKVLYEAYRDYIDVGRDAGDLMKNRTLLSMGKKGAAQFLKGARDWEYLLARRVSKELYLKLIEQVGVEEAKKQIKPCPAHCSYSKATIKHDYYFTCGIFFQTLKDLDRAVSLLSSDETLEGVLMSSKQALIAHYLQVSLQGKMIQEMDIVQFSSQILKRDHRWFEVCRETVKKNMLNQINRTYSKHLCEFKNNGLKQFDSAIETEWLKEESMDDYSPSLRPDLFERVVNLPKRSIVQK